MITETQCNMDEEDSFLVTVHQESNKLSLHTAGIDKDEISIRMTPKMAEEIIEGLTTGVERLKKYREVFKVDD